MVSDINVIKFKFKIMNELLVSLFIIFKVHQTAIYLLCFSTSRYVPYATISWFGGSNLIITALTAVKYVYQGHGLVSRFVTIVNWMTMIGHQLYSTYVLVKNNWPWSENMHPLKLWVPSSIDSLWGMRSKTVAFDE